MVSGLRRLFLLTSHKRQRLAPIYFAIQMLEFTCYSSPTYFSRRSDCLLPLPVEDSRLKFFRCLLQRKNYLVLLLLLSYYTFASFLNSEASVIKLLRYSFFIIQPASTEKMPRQWQGGNVPIVHDPPPQLAIIFLSPPLIDFSIKRQRH